MCRWVRPALALGAIVIALSLASTSAEAVFKEETKTCHPDCTQYGNCNGETGQCDCPMGLTGPSCQERLYPACHSSKEPGTVPHYGTWYPKNCYCVKQIRDRGCPTDIHFEGHSGFQNPCLYDIARVHDWLCYRYKDVPEADQLSDSPSLNDTGVEWVKIIGWTKQERVLAPEEVPKVVNTPDGGTWRPLRECPDKCNNQGWCQTKGGDQYGHWKEDPEERWCQCHSFWKGKSCEETDTWHCYRNCSGVGSCKSGWCHCQEGYWGHGCTRTKAYTSASGWSPNHGDIKVYVYDIPESVIHRREFNDQWPTIDVMYNSEIEFTELLLGDWSVRTQNPWEASLFYVPMFTYWYSGNIGDPWVPMQHVTRWLQHHSPFFNLTGGRNHIMWATNDRGTCALQHAPLEMQHSIKLVHFGQSPRRQYAQRNRAHSGAGGEHSLIGSVLPLPGHRFKEFPDFTAQDILQENEMCFRPDKDVVSPNYIGGDWTRPDIYGRVWNVTDHPDGTRTVRWREEPELNRTQTFFFAGYSKPVMTYSQGVRQAIHKMFGDEGKHGPKGSDPRPDYKVQGPSHNAIHEMQTTKFCMAPMGAGWGIRLSEAMVTGCVPVIVQDHVYQALWDVLPYEDFSIRIPRSSLHRLVEILDDVTPEQLRKLQGGIEKWHRAFIWDAFRGGLAYNHTLTSLKRKAISLFSANYRRQS